MALASAAISSGVSDIRDVDPLCRRCRRLLMGPSRDEVGDRRNDGATRRGVDRSEARTGSRSLRRAPTSARLP